MKLIRKTAVFLLCLCLISGVFALSPIAKAAGCVYLDATAVTLGNETWYGWTWDGVSDGWVRGSVESNGYLRFDNVGNYIIFTRMDAAQKPSWNSGILWNRTGNLKIENDLFVITGWGSGYGAELPGYWKEYKIATEPTRPDYLPDTETDLYELADSVNDGMILQAWNWSYNNTVSMLDKVKAAGFTTIQISPPNVICGSTKNRTIFDSTGGWWAYYQPAAFKINDLSDNALGTKSELVNMVQKAHEKGIKVIADAVINHTAANRNTSDSFTNPQDHLNDRVRLYEPELCENNLFHKPWVSMKYKERYSDGYSDYDIEEDLTQHAQSNLPDLDTSNAFVQNKIFTYLKELVDAGIDGFRIDAAKHIETPSDTYFGSDFLPNTIGKVKDYARSVYDRDMLIYGEIIGSPGDGRPYSEYTPYMKVSDTAFYWDVANNVNGGSASGAIPINTYASSKENCVVWNETHDSYVDYSTRNLSEVVLNKRWAACAARDTVSAVYLARPNSTDQLLGEASESYWANWSVREVNNFSNQFVGQGEYLSSGSNVAVIGRGEKHLNGGAVLINCDDGTTKSVSGVPVYTLADGTYRDRISGNQFYVSSNTVSGTIGDTGIAVLYKDQPASVYAKDSSRYYTDTLTLTLHSKNVDYATYEINGTSPVRFSGAKTVTVGKASDAEGATYKFTLKGYRDGALKCEQSYEYTKSAAGSSYVVTLNTNSAAGWGSVKLYAWNSRTNEKLAAWSGVQMNLVSGVYTYTLPRTYDRIIFNSGTAQTVDIPISDSTDYTLLSTYAVNTSGVSCNQVSSKPAAYNGAKYYPDPYAAEPVTTTEEPTTVTEPTTEEPTTVTEPTTEEPTTVTESTTEEPTTMTEATTAEPTTDPTEEPTTAETQTVTETETDAPSTEPSETETNEATTEPSETATDSTAEETATAAESTTEETQAETVLGDVNRDGAFDVRDATDIKKHLAELITLTDEQIASSDYTNDGILDVRDATKLMKILAELDSFFQLIIK